MAALTFDSGSPPALQAEVCAYHKKLDYFRLQEKFESRSLFMQVEVVDM